MTIDWTRAVVLSVAEIDVLWEQLGLGATPAALELPSPGRTYEERDRIVRDALDTLRDRALVVGSSPVRGLVSDLVTLARADEVRDLVVTAPARYAAVAAISGDRGVLAVHLDERVALLRFPPVHAAAALVELAGPLRPGPGPAVRIPARVLHEAVTASAGNRERFATELMRRGVQAPEARAVLRMGELAGIGQLGGARRTTGGMRRAPYFLLVHVTTDGCYRQRRVPRDGAEPLVEAGPVDGPTLVRELDELVARAG